jgi:hypothetical protein
MSFGLDKSRTLGNEKADCLEADTPKFFSEPKVDLPALPALRLIAIPRSRTSGSNGDSALTECSQPPPMVSANPAPRLGLAMLSKSGV